MPETNKPFTSLRLNSKISNKKEIPATGSQGARFLPPRTFAVLQTGPSTEVFYPVTSSAIFRSNMVNTSNGSLIMLNQFDSMMNNGSITVWDDEAHNLFQHTKTANEFDLKTKDFDFGDASRRKKIYKVYVTFKTKFMRSGVIMKYATNGSSNFSGTFDNDDTYYNADRGFYGNLTEEWVTVGLKPSASLSDVNSLALQFTYGDSGNIGKLAADSSAGSNTITLAGTSSIVDDYYVGMPIYFYFGPGNGQVHRVSAYNKTTKVVTLTENLSIDVTTETHYDVGYIPASFAINDISIVYRNKIIK